MRGSPSSEPNLIAISSPSGHSAPKRLEPQREQNALTRPFPGRYTLISSPPATSRKPLRGTRPCVPPNAPECLRQREQWQWLRPRQGGVPSKRTPPQRQEPPTGCSGLGAVTPGRVEEQILAVAS